MKPPKYPRREDFLTKEDYEKYLKSHKGRVEVMKKAREAIKRKVITVDPFKQVVKLGGIRIPPIGWMKTI